MIFFQILNPIFVVGKDERVYILEPKRTRGSTGIDLITRIRGYFQISFSRASQSRIILFHFHGQFPNCVILSLRQLKSIKCTIEYKFFVVSVWFPLIVQQQLFWSARFPVIVPSSAIYTITAGAINLSLDNREARNGYCSLASIQSTGTVQANFGLDQMLTILINFQRNWLNYAFIQISIVKRT